MKLQHLFQCLLCHGHFKADRDFQFQWLLHFNGLLVAIYRFYVPKNALGPLRLSARIRPVGTPRPMYFGGPIPSCPTALQTCTPVSPGEAFFKCSKQTVHTPSAHLPQHGERLPNHTDTKTL